MNTYDKMLIRVCKTMCNCGAMCYDYTWEQDFCKKEMSNLIVEIKKTLTESNFDICKCSKDVLMTLGFSNWDDNDNMLLIPLWAVLVLDENTPVVSIFGEHTILKYIDHDVRFGCVAYMIEVNKEGKTI